MLKKFRLFIIIGILVLIYLPGFARLQELKTKLAQTELETRRAQRQNALLEEKIASMKSREYLEIVAREKMGMVKKGETVIKIIRDGDQMPETENTAPANVTKP